MRRARIKAVANVPARRKIDELKTEKIDDNTNENHDTNDTVEEKCSGEIKTEIVTSDVPEKPRGRIRAVAKVPIRRNKNTESNTDTTVTPDDVTASDETNFVKPCDENESVFRPSPVTSPSIQYRPRIRSKPRLDSHHRSGGDDRRNSTSASESDDEYSRRNIRNRFDNSSSNILCENSVPLNTLTTINNCHNGDVNAVVKESCTKVNEEIHKNILSPNKNNVCNKDSSIGVPLGSPLSQQQTCIQQTQQQSIMKRKVRRSDFAKKIAEAKRDFYNKFGSKTPDRQKLTMMDLIFYNPTSNPMLKSKTSSSSASSNCSNKTKREQNNDSASSVASFNDNESVHSMSTRADEEVVDEPEEEQMQPVPQVKIGENGEIILDEQSVIIETTDQQIQRMNKSRELTETAINYDELNTTYGIYKRAKRTKDWSIHETKQFYRVLQMIGTDFSMMLAYFKDRTRRDLKLKFKKEEKINRHLIDKVLLNPCTFDLQQLQQSLEHDQQQLNEQQLNQQQIQEIKRQDQMQRKRKTHEKRVRYKTGSWLARQMYIEKKDMIQSYDEDDPPDTQPSEEPHGDDENTLNSTTSNAPQSQETNTTTPQSSDESTPPLKKPKFVIDEIHNNDNDDDDETEQLVAAMFGKQTTTRFGRKIRSKIRLNNENIVPDTNRTDNDAFITPHANDNDNALERNDNMIVSMNQNEVIDGCNQEINFEEVLYRHDNVDNFHDDLKTFTDGDNRLVIDLNSTDGNQQMIDDHLISNNNNNNNNNKNILEDYLGNNETITLELPVVSSETSDQFKIILELTNQNDDDKKID